MIMKDVNDMNRMEWTEMKWMHEAHACYGWAKLSWTREIDMNAMDNGTQYEWHTRQKWAICTLWKVETCVLMNDMNEDYSTEDII